MNPDEVKLLVERLTVHAERLPVINKPDLYRDLNEAMGLIERLTPDGADTCKAPGCDNLTDCDICDECDQWVSEQVAGRCTMGVGCDESGVCYAVAHGEPERCPRQAAGHHP